METQLEIKWIFDEWLDKFDQYDETFAYHMMMVLDARGYSTRYVRTLRSVTK